MTTIDTTDLPYYGSTTRAPDVLATAEKGDLACSRCASSLVGRFEEIRTTPARGTRKVYLCRWG